MAKEKIYSPYEYVGKVWCDWKNKEEGVKGVLFAYSLSEAAKKLDQEYGDELTEIKIVPCEEDQVYEFGENRGCIFDTTGVKVKADKSIKDPSIADRVEAILTNVGQSDPQFSLGETIRYTPTEVGSNFKKSH